MASRKNPSKREWQVWRSLTHKDVICVRIVQHDACARFHISIGIFFYIRPECWAILPMPEPHKLQHLSCLVFMVGEHILSGCRNLHHSCWYFPFNIDPVSQNSMQAPIRLRCLPLILMPIQNLVIFLFVLHLLYTNYSWTFYINPKYIILQK